MEASDGAMAKLAYKDILRDEEVEDFIRTYCTFHDEWRLERGKSPRRLEQGKSPKDSLWPEYCWWLNTRDRGSMAAVDLKTIFEEILKADRRVFHTWKSPEGMRLWFDLNKIAKDKQS